MDPQKPDGICLLSPEHHAVQVLRRIELDLARDDYSADDGKRRAELAVRIYCALKASSP